MRRAALLLLASLITSCGHSNSDSSIVVQRSVDPKVENGTAFDTATYELGDAARLVVPDNSVVRRDGTPHEVRLFMAKTLSFAGHPPTPLSVRDVRKNMGCAARREGDDLVIATVGEWDSHIEGGASMRLVIVAPEKMPVEPRGGLSGERSATAVRARGIALLNALGSPAPEVDRSTMQLTEWKRIPDKPDPDHTAR